VEQQFEFLPLREKLVPNKAGGVTVKYEIQSKPVRYLNVTCLGMKNNYCTATNKKELLFQNWYNIHHTVFFESFKSFCPPQAKFPVVHGYHFVGGRLIYTKPPMAKQGYRYRNLNKQFLSVNATGYYGALGAPHTASSRAYQMHQGRQGRIRPVSNYRKRQRKNPKTAPYHPGNILVPLPLNAHRSNIHPQVCIIFIVS